MEQYRVSPIVFSSSCTVYGQPKDLPVTEDAPMVPAESPYGNTKQICEEILRDSVRSMPALQVIALRYFNPIGAHPTALIGELPSGIPNNLVPFVTQTAAGLRPELNVFGDDYPTPDGSAVRDYINVTDLARAHVTAIRRLLDGKNSSAYEFFNLGTGRGSSVLEIVKTFEKVTGVKVNHKIVGRRAGDIIAVWADTSKANDVLGWKAVTSLEDTLLSAWNWEKKLRGIK
jgi:UDP-glucose 4-epimerase